MVNSMKKDEINSFDQHVAQLQSDISLLEKKWEQKYPNKKKGARSALAGFYCQFSFFLLELIGKFLKKETCRADVFTECLSDIITCNSNQLTLISQVKRTQSSASIKDALSELWDIYHLAANEIPRIKTRIKFRVLSSRTTILNVEKSVKNWCPKDQTFAPHLIEDFKSRVQVEINSHPDDELVTILANELGALNPIDSINNWMGILLSAGEKGNFESASNRIWEDLTKIRKAKIDQKKPPGIYVWTKLDRHVEEVKRGKILTGEQPTAYHLRTGFFAVRKRLYSDILIEAEKWFDEKIQKDLESNRLPIFWISGRSGGGKSIALLHLLSDLHDLGIAPILHLGNKVELLPDAIIWAQYFANKSFPSIISIDDPYSPAAHQDSEKIWNKAIAILEDCFQSGSVEKVPALICCGPTEQAECLENDFFGEVKISTYELPIETKTDYEDLREWYLQRTGKIAPRIVGDNALLVQLFFEWEVGSSLNDFGRRFQNRICDIDCAAKCADDDKTLLVTLSKVLALNQLNTGYPELAITHHIKYNLRHSIKRLHDEHKHLDLKKRGNQEGYWIAHPHLSYAIFQAWYPNTEMRLEFIRQGIIDCIKFGNNPTEQIAPLWSISNSILSKNESIIDSIPNDLVFEMLRSTYNDWPAKDKGEIPIAHLPIWIQFSILCPHIKFYPNPIDISINAVNYKNINSQGLRLTCHKLIESYKHINRSKQKKINIALLNLLSRSFRWVEWPFVAHDALNKIGDLEYIKLVSIWVENNKHKKAAVALLLNARGWYPDNRSLLELAERMIADAEDSLLWGDVGVSLIKGKSEIPTGVIKWAEKNHNNYCCCFLLRELMLHGFPSSLKWAREWIRLHYHTKNANYVLETYCEAVEAIDDEICNYCLEYISIGHNSSDWLLQILIKRFPKNTKISNFSHKYLDHISVSYKQWKFVWEALWENEPSERLFDLGINWIKETNYDHDAWPFMWDKLWEVDSNHCLTTMAKDWLIKGPEDHLLRKKVWEKLWEHTKDHQLIDIAEKWLVSNCGTNDFWGGTWQLLWKIKPSKKLNLIGRKWLEIAFDNDSWSYVWENLWSKSNDEELFSLGYRWIRESFEDRGWRDVWLELLKSEKNTHKLIDLAKEWLSITPFTNILWTYVWQPIWNYHEGARDDVLYNLAINWLKSSPKPKENKVWGDVWEALWRFKKTVNLSKMGKVWLKYADQNLGSYIYIWKLIWESDRSHGIKDKNLLRLGLNWLANEQFSHRQWGKMLRILWQAMHDDVIIELCEKYLKKANPDYIDYKKTKNFILSSVKRT